MTDLQLPPFFAALCKSCETICERECCGIGAFNFSPFNIIYHLTKWNACIRDSDVEEIRNELTDFTAKLQSSGQHSERIILAELNAILTANQMIALIADVDSAIFEACAIYAGQKDRIDERYQSFLRIIKTPE